MTFTTLFTKKSFQLLLGISLISTVYLIYSSNNPQNITKQLLPLPTPTPISTIKSNQILFQKIKNYEIIFDNSISLDSFPKFLNVYSASLKSEDLNTVAQKIIKKFSLIQPTDNSNLWMSQNKNYSLDIDYKKQNFTFTQKFKDSIYSQNYTVSQAENYSKNILSSYFSSQNLSLIPDKTRFTKAIKNQPEWEFTTPDKANLISLNYGYNIDKYPYYYENNIHPNLSLLIGPNNTLYNLFYISQPEALITDPIEKTRLNPDQIKNLLESGQGEILSLNLMTLPPNSTSLPILTITNISIEYRYNSDTKKAVPFFRIIAIYDNSDVSKEFPVTIILPAVEL